MWTLDFIHHPPGPRHHSHALPGLCFYESGCPSPISYLGSWTVLRQDLYHLASTLANTDGLPSSPSQYSDQYWWHAEGRPSSDLRHLASTLTNTDDILKVDLRLLASTLTNTDDILKVDLRHLASTLTNTDDILKVAPRHLASTLTNTDDKADDFTRGRSVASNRLLTPRHWVMIDDDNFIPRQVDDLQIDT